MQQQLTQRLAESEVRFAEAMAVVQQLDQQLVEARAEIESLRGSLPEEEEPKPLGTPFPLDESLADKTQPVPLE